MPAPAGYTQIAVNLAHLDASGQSGTIEATLSNQLTLANGQVIPPERWPFTVTNGTAILTLPATDATSPANVPISLALVDTQGRKRLLGAIVVPTSATVVNLDTLLPVLVVDGVQIRKGMKYLGPWDNTHAYLIDDVVTFEGQVWIAVGGSTNKTPAAGIYWSLLLPTAVGPTTTTTGAYTVAVGAAVIAVVNASAFPVGADVVITNGVQRSYGKISAKTYTSLTFTPSFAGGDAVVGYVYPAGSAVSVAGAQGAPGNMTNPMTTPGDLVYGSTAGQPARLAGNTSAVRKFLRQIGDGVSAAFAPIWDTLVSGDVTSALGFTPENAAKRGVANGYVPTDASNLVPVSYLPVLPQPDASTSTKGLAKTNVAPSSPTNPVVIAAENGAVATTHLAANAVTSYAEAVLLNTNASTISTTYVDMHATLSVTITTTGGPVLILMSGGVGYITNGGTGWIGVNVDGTDYDMLNVYQANAATYTATVITGLLKLSLSAGSHTIKLRFKTSSASKEFYASYYGSVASRVSLSAIELKR